MTMTRRGRSGWRGAVYGRLGAAGLLWLGGCAAVATTGGAAVILALAVAAGYFTGQLEVRFDNSPEDEVLSDNAGEVRLAFEESGMLREYEGVLPGLNTVGATQATIDLAVGEITGTVTTPDGERQALSEVVPGLSAERIGNENRIRVGLTTVDGQFDYEMDFSRLQAQEEGRRVQGEVEITRRLTQDGELVYEDTGWGSMDVDRTSSLGERPTEPLEPLAAPIRADAGPHLEAEPGEPVTLQAAAAGGEGELNYAWEPQESLDNPALLQPTATPPGTTTYTLTVADGLGQQVSDAMTVVVRSTDDSPSEDPGADDDADDVGGDDLPDDIDTDGESDCPGPFCEDPDLLDSDADGVPNVDDACPNTPPDEAVDSQGCSPMERDTDGDGINDAFDACPDTELGAEVDEFGCAAPIQSLPEPQLIATDVERWDSAAAMNDPVVVYTTRGGSSSEEDVYVYDPVAQTATYIATVDLEHLQGDISSRPRISADGRYAAYLGEPYHSSEGAIYVYDRVTGAVVRQIGDPHTGNQPDTWGSLAIGLRSLVFPSYLELDCSFSVSCEPVSPTTCTGFPPPDWYQQFFSLDSPDHWWQHYYDYRFGSWEFADCPGSDWWTGGPGTDLEVWWTRVDESNIEHTTCEADWWLGGAYFEVHYIDHAYQLLSDSPRTGYGYCNRGGLAVSDDDKFIAYAGEAVYAHDHNGAVILWDVDASCDSSERLLGIAGYAGYSPDCGVYGVGMSGTKDGDDLLVYCGYHDKQAEKDKAGGVVYVRSSKHLLFIETPGGHDEFNGLDARQLAPDWIRLLIRAGEWWSSEVFVKDLRLDAGKWTADQAVPLPDLADLDDLESSQVWTAKLAGDGHGLVFLADDDLYSVALPSDLY